MNQSQWNPQIRQNSLPHVSAPNPPQNQPYNQQVWPNVNPMHPQQFANIPMPGFNMPFFPQQMLQDAFAMSVPVEQADEKILLQALVESRNRRETYKDALNALHGKNGHSASLWKDYYLDHKDRLDETVSVYLNPPKIALQAIKKPSPSAFKTESSPLPTRIPVAAKRQTPSDHSAHRPSQSTGGRNTINSLTTPAPVFGDRLPAPNADIQIPDPPSRSPTPPTIVIPHRGRGNKYTPQDRDFFLKFISWRLKGDPTLTRNDLCALLAEKVANFLVIHLHQSLIYIKAPHHTSQSWASYWSNRHDVPDKILAAAKGDEYESNKSSDSEEEEKITRRRPKYRDSSSEEEDEEKDGEEKDEKSDAEGESDADDDEDEEGIKVWSESEMGAKGGPFTDADLYVTSKYVAFFPDWEDASGKTRWQPYSDRFPQRSAKSWAEYYRRNEKQIVRLAKKIRKQGHDTPPKSSIQTQRARPSWASSVGNDTNQSKRKHSIDLDAEGEDDDEGPPNRNKRGRGGDA
ncbi:hypothetical protein H0H81_000964 [Sphagnurus paluster]|uniref:Uncharacterized protein n=1 Tax=Sphagnurus paluster TaxID=117069 RepID=A0A9P7GME7_9AGAR|nr:hypothetical protein H0H81_000964 [Sphagnurus paluster]